MKYNTVYHYCCAQNFCSIILSKQLWLSDACCLDDQGEHRFGLEMARGVLEEHRSNRPDLGDACAAMICEIDNNRIHPFVGCFSFNRESQRQWRERAENATGFAIGFNRVKLEELLAFGLADSAGWGRVEYDLSDQRSRINTAIDEYFLDDRHRVNRLGGDPRILQGVTIEQHFGALWKVAALIKRSDFEWEEEWRLIAMPREDLHALDLNAPPPDFNMPLTLGQYSIKSREKGGRRIRFFTFPFPADCITEVHVGSKWHNSGNEQALEDVLKSSGIHHARVIGSSIV